MISSLAGQNANTGLAAYCASKAALDHFARCLMLEVRQSGHQGHRPSPRARSTPPSPVPRVPADASWMLSPEDLAQTVVDLARMREGAHSSRVEMRPARPQTR